MLSVLRDKFARIHQNINNGCLWGEKLGEQSIMKFSYFYNKKYLIYE